MTTIDHQQAAVDSAARVLFCMQHRVSESRFDLAAYEALAEASTREARNALAAATPHLRAAWEQPIRELHRPIGIEPSDTICGECSFRLPNGDYFGKVVDWPCPTLDLLEGGGE